jgi:hypothetical protein
VNALWTMVVTYRTQNGPNVVEFDLEEIWDAHDIIERGPDWSAIMDIKIHLAFPTSGCGVLKAQIQPNPHYNPELARKMRKGGEA